MFKKLKTENDPQTKMIFWHIFAGSKGCVNRVKIIYELQKIPLNINQLATKLGLDHKVVERHVTVLEKNELIIKVGRKYGATYFISSFLESNLKIFEEIVRKAKNCNDD